MSVAALLAAAAAALAAAGIVDLAAAVGERGADGARRRGPRSSPSLARLGRRLGAPAPPADLERRIAAAGAPASLRVADVMAVKAGAALRRARRGAAARRRAARSPRASSPRSARPPAASCCPTSGSRAASARRGRAMAAELADVLDLLRVAVDAGLSPGRARCSEVGRRRHGALAAELRAAAARIELGVPRADVLADARAPLPGRGHRAARRRAAARRAPRRAARPRARRARRRRARPPRAAPARARRPRRAEDPARRRAAARAGGDAARRRGAGDRARLTAGPGVPRARESVAARRAAGDEAHRSRTSPPAAPVTAGRSVG